MRASEQQVATFEQVSARVLGIGVYTSAGVLLAGLVGWALALEPWASRVLNAGLVLLMITPAARVFVSLVEYARARDWFFVATTCGVLLVLLAALLTAVLAR